MVLKTKDEVKADFSKNGISIGSWAVANGFARTHVYAVLGGRNRAKYGQAHVIAVALGLKEGLVGLTPQTFKAVKTTAPRAERAAA